ncbi:MAG: HIT family protein [Nanoarchaeota archaeon]|nr:HIT family protein [Nanoarchaeota archaeon]
MEQCIFCNIVAGKIPSYKVYEDEFLVAILDINPANPGHIVLLPKPHIRSIMELSPQQLSKLAIVARALSLALLEFGAEGVNFLYSMGEAAGQRSPHLLIHIIPRYKEDKVRFIWEPKKFSEEDLKKHQQKLSSLINKSVQTQQQVHQPPQQRVVKKEEPQQKRIYSLEPRHGGYW